MEADWEIEIAPNAPVIDAAWAGFVDLRHQAERISELAEPGRLPALRDALRQLNSVGSPVFTSKCDLWDPGQIDPYELNASHESAAHALACYIDVLRAGNEVWRTPESAIGWAQSVCERMTLVTLKNCRIDMVVRRAFLPPGERGMGVTCYLAGCGETHSAASDALSRGLSVFADTVGKADSADESR